MTPYTRRVASLTSLCVMLGASAVALAQNAAPARETPRPEDIDPAVNTSAMPAESESPSPSPASADAAKGATSGAPAASGAAGNAGSNSAAGASSRNAASAGRQNASGVPGQDAAGAERQDAAGATGQSAAGDAASTPRAAGEASTGAGANPGAPSGAARTAAASDGKPRGGKAQDRIELDTTQITGNRELPKVLYIVPWKRSDLGDLVGKPVNSLLDEVLTPVDRDVFQRENRYYRALTPADGQPAGATGAPGSGNAPAAASSNGSAAPAARDER